MTTEAPKTQKKPRRKRKNTGWVPDQHGAWVMVTVPLLLGVGLAGPSWIHLPLAVAWMTGYFAFFALGLWVKARGPRKAAFRRPLATYGGVSAAASIIVVAMHPAVVLWGVVFAPLVGVAVWEMYRRRPRSLLSGEATVLASCVMVPLASSVVGEALDARLWTITALVALYFVGTIPYVKTLIRERGDHVWFVGSVVYHCVVTAVAAALSAVGYASWWSVVVFAVLAVRAWWMPWSVAHRGKKWTPKVVGLWESASTLAVVIVALLNN